jgi:hypothetical protein
LLALLGNLDRAVGGAFIAFVTVYLVKLGVCYIIEGQTPPKSKEPKPPSN